jgi:hypothetical protein
VYITTLGASVPDDAAPEPEAVNGGQVFYSRRGSGPIYRWLYEKSVDYWRPRRMNTSDAETRRLSVASWKTLPDSLQVELCKHYLD